MARLAVAGGTPSFASDQTTGMTPVQYSNVLNAELYARTVLGEIANTDYVKDVSESGDTVVIAGLPDIAVSAYVPHQGLTYQTPTPAEVKLEINKALSWALSLNDVQRKQSHHAYGSKWTDHAATKLGIEVDTDFLANVYGDVHASNSGATAGAKSGDINLGVSGTPLVATSINALEILVDWGLILDEQNVPADGRWAVIPPWFWSRILLSDLKDASLAGDSTSIIRNGKVGRVADFTIFRSNLLTVNASDSAWSCIYGHKMGVTFASQMRKSETLRNPNDFGDLLRGLMVYGYKVTKPEALGHGYLSKS